ncbi:hypothetical protein ACFSC4_31305 [Deinococcus malanensis]|uniref:hypothetical protein n=1 Tax=Deinococcus malanensis TaxID=1706855 RepID=UPI00363730BC
MNILNWRLRVWPAAGAAQPRIIERDTSWVLPAGFALPLTPEGDAREGRFPAKGSGIQLPTLSAVQFQIETAPDVWTSLYYGEVKQGGNARDVKGENYVLRSLSRSLGEVVVPEGFSTPDQAAHLTIRAIVEAVLPDLAGIVEYDALLVADLGFTFGAIRNGNQQTALALIEAVVAAGAALQVNDVPTPVHAVYGVNPDRKYFCQVRKTDTVVLTAEDIALLEWKSPVAETPCTAVLWFIAKRADGSWVKHLSVSPHAATYRKRVKPLSVDATLDVWRKVPGTFQVGQLAGGSEDYTFTPDAVQPSPEAVAGLTDGLIARTDPKLSVTASAAGAYVWFKSNGLQIDRVTVAGADATATPASPSGNVGLLWHPGDAVPTAASLLTIYHPFLPGSFLPGHGTGWSAYTRSQPEAQGARRSCRRCCRWWRTPTMLYSWPSSARRASIPRCWIRWPKRTTASQPRNRLRSCCTA